MLDNHPLPIKLKNQDSSPWFFSYGFEGQLSSEYSMVAQLPKTILKR